MKHLIKYWPALVGLVISAFIPIGNGHAVDQEGILAPAKAKVESRVEAGELQTLKVLAYAEVPQPVYEYSESPSTNTGNETRIWNYLIAHGYSRNQTAGIMGNLQQEHNFNTSDSAGGLGIAQWIGGRRDNLIASARRNGVSPNDLILQLNFLMEELRGAESAANNAIKASDSVEGATIAFQDLFERCGVCRQEQRIQYAYSILKRH